MDCFSFIRSTELQFDHTSFHFETRKDDLLQLTYALYSRTLDTLGPVSTGEFLQWKLEKYLRKSLAWLYLAPATIHVRTVMQSLWAEYPMDGWILPLIANAWQFL